MEWSQGTDDEAANPLDGVEVVDAHCHASLVWFEPIEALREQMLRNDVGQAVLVQMNGQSDNTYQEQCVRQDPASLASVVRIDQSAGDVAYKLREAAARGATGVRIRPEERAPRGDPLALWKAAEQLGMAVSTGGSSAELLTDELEEAIATVADIAVVLEHAGALNHPNEHDTLEARRRVLDLARYSNVYVKIHGLGEFARRALPVSGAFPFERPLPPVLDDALERFGPQRMLWGSDFPPCSYREGYHNALRLTAKELSSLSHSERADIFGGNARRLYWRQHQR